MVDIRRQPDGNPDDDDYIVIYPSDHPMFSGAFPHVVKKPHSPETRGVQDESVQVSIIRQMQRIRGELSSDDLKGIDLNDPEQTAGLNLDRPMDDEVRR